jgi:hypothetical protein
MRNVESKATKGRGSPVQTKDKAIGKPRVHIALTVRVGAENFIIGLRNEVAGAGITRGRDSGGGGKRKNSSGRRRRQKSRRRGARAWSSHLDNAPVVGGDARRGHTAGDNHTEWHGGLRHGLMGDGAGEAGPHEKAWGLLLLDRRLNARLKAARKVAGSDERRSKGELTSGCEGLTATTTEHVGRGGGKGVKGPPGHEDFKPRILTGHRRNDGSLKRRKRNGLEPLRVVFDRGGKPVDVEVETDGLVGERGGGESELKLAAVVQRLLAEGGDWNERSGRNRGRERGSGIRRHSERDETDRDGDRDGTDCSFQTRLLKGDGGLARFTCSLCTPQLTCCGRRKEWRRRCQVAGGAITSGSSGRDCPRMIGEHSCSGEERNQLRATRRAERKGATDGLTAGSGLRLKGMQGLEKGGKGV